MKTINTQRTIALGTLTLMGATLVGGMAAKPAQADSKTWKNVAIGAGVVGIYGLIKGDSKLATIGGVAAAGSYLKYKSEKKDEQNDWRYDRNHNNAYRYNDYRYNSNRNNNYGYGYRR